MRDYFGNDGGPLVGDPAGLPRTKTSSTEFYWLADYLEPELGYPFLTAKRHRLPERFRWL